MNGHRTKRRPAWRTRVLGVLGLWLVACGTGGTPEYLPDADPSQLAGRILFSAEDGPGLPGGPILEAEPNDTHDTAHYLGEIRAGDVIVVHGHTTAVGDTDPYDGFELLAPERVEVTATLEFPEGGGNDFDMGVFDLISLQFVEVYAAPSAPEVGTFIAKGAFDFVVEAWAGSGDYVLTLAATAPASPIVEREPNDDPDESRFLGELPVGDEIRITGSASSVADTNDGVLVSLPCRHSPLRLPVLRERRRLRSLRGRRHVWSERSVPSGIVRQSGDEPRAGHRLRSRKLAPPLRRRGLVRKRRVDAGAAGRRARRHGGEDARSDGRAARLARRGDEALATHPRGSALRTTGTRVRTRTGAGRLHGRCRRPGGRRREARRPHRRAPGPDLLAGRDRGSCGPRRRRPRALDAVPHRRAPGNARYRVRRAELRRPRVRGARRPLLQPPMALPADQPRGGLGRSAGLRLDHRGGHRHRTNEPPGSQRATGGRIRLHLQRFQRPGRRRPGLGPHRRRRSPGTGRELVLPRDARRRHDRRGVQQRPWRGRRDVGHPDHAPARARTRRRHDRRHRRRHSLRRPAHERRRGRFRPSVRT